MENSTRLLNCTNPESVMPSVFEYTRKFKQEFGRTTASFISSILGGNAMHTVKYLNIDSLAGKCVICGATDELHFDHDVPWSRGGTSITEENVQLLCARHNLQKHDRIV